MNKLKRKFAEREEDLENQLNKGALWAITYGDLMSYLMLFFLLMFAFAVSSGNLNFIEALSKVQEAFGGEHDEILGCEQVADETVLNARRGGKWVRIRRDGSVLEER